MRTPQKGETPQTPQKGESKKQTTGDDVPERDDSDLRAQEVARGLRLCVPEPDAARCNCRCGGWRCDSFGNVRDMVRDISVPGWLCRSCGTRCSVHGAPLTVARRCRCAGRTAMKVDGNVANDDDVIFTTAIGVLEREPAEPTTGWPAPPGLAAPTTSVLRSVAVL